MTKIHDKILARLDVLQAQADKGRDGYFYGPVFHVIEVK